MSSSALYLYNSISCDWANFSLWRLITQYEIFSRVDLSPRVYIKHFRVSLAFRNILVLSKVTRAG
jgi:hypothetical protein